VISTTKKRAHRPRSYIASTGSFVAIPDAFPDASDSIKNAIKLEFKTEFSQKHRVQTVFSTDKILIDIAAVDSSKLDPRTIAADCDLFKAIALKHPKELRQLIVAMQLGGLKNILKAQRIAEAIGLTEGNAVKAGAGFIWLLVPLVGAFIGGCATVGSNKPLKQSTLPKPAAGSGPSGHVQ